MGDLEDAFLRKNVPGRYSSWADEDDDERHNDDVDVDRGGGGGVAVGAGEDEDEDDEYYLRDLPPPPPPHHRHHRAPSSSSSSSSSGGGGTRSNTGVKFIEVDALEANPNLDAICLPAILIYRHGELVHNLVRFDDDLPRDFGAGDVRAIFEGLGVLGPTAIARRRGCF